MGINKKIRVLELFSGIGGMHYALEDSGLDYEVVLAADINTLANSVYRHNFPDVKIQQTNIQSLNSEFFKALSPDMIVMSPPCQPFTRVGLKKDTEDARTCPLLHFIDIFEDLPVTIRYILLENVQGFETSDTRQMLLASVRKAGFDTREFLISPHLCSAGGSPNSRTRYYLLCKRLATRFTFPSTTDIMRKLPTGFDCRNVEHRRQNRCISDYLEILDDDSSEYDRYLIPREVVERRIGVYDIVVKSDVRSMCFTKAYTRYAEGTGSVYCPSHRQIDRNEQYNDPFVTFRLRYFTPREVANLMCFPRSFSLPAGVTDKQAYRLLGNSINVHVVAVLIGIMCQEPSVKISDT